MMFIVVTVTGISFGQESAATDKGDDRPLRILSKPRPAYTEEARQNKVDGKVQVSVVFEADGRIGEVECVNPENENTEKLKKFGLVNATIDAVRLIKFDPEVKGGNAITIKKVLEYSFAIY